MLTLPPGARVFVATARVDGRKGIDGLSALVRSQFAEDPLSGSMYVFFSRRGDRVRVLYFDRDGYHHCVRGPQRRAAVLFGVRSDDGMPGSEVTTRSARGRWHDGW